MVDSEYGRLREFYNRMHSGDRYSAKLKAEDHAFNGVLETFIDQYQLQGKKCLEIGCGRGAFQDLVSDYTGTDISDAVRAYLHKPACQCSATELPFKDGSFEAIWEYAVLEHVPKPERAFEEMRRVLKNNGLLLLSPAWQCRTWAAEGYPVRPYSDFDLKGKLIKASIPIRNLVLFRSMYIFPRRLIRLITYLLTKRSLRFKYRELTPNYDIFWMDNSDAVNSMEPYEAILWFVSRGDKCISYPNSLSQFFVRRGAIIFRIQKDGKDT
jgi:ubiquinone/menaquinone biosynthesis C-methylase UbiE